MAKDMTLTSVKIQSELFEDFKVDKGASNLGLSLASNES